MPEPIETLTVGDLTARIEHDPEPPDPRDGDNFCKLVLFGKARGYGDQHEYRSGDYHGWDELEASILKANPGGIVKPVYLLDHSGITISTSDWMFRAIDPQGWDWGQVGFAVVSGEGIRQNYVRSRVTAKLRQRAENPIDDEVAVLSQLLAGDCYAFIIEDLEGQIVDSCGGLIGYAHAVEEARAAAEALA